MNKLDEFKYNVAGKNITVIGIGISNLPLIKYLVSLGANVTACDRRSAEDLGENYTELEKLGVKFNLGDGYLNNLSGDMIFKTPGMRYDVPELLKAKENGSIVTSEMEVFFEVCPSHIIAVTGSDGKTTTTTLIHKMMTDAGYKTWLGGNIGIPLFTKLNEIEKEDIVVLELSSFQLMGMEISPSISVITNITPNHLNIHKDYEEYIEAKKNIFKYQNENGILVLNYDNEITRNCAKEANGKVIFFSSKEKLENGYIVDNGIIKECEDKIRKHVLDAKDVKLRGVHNYENICTALAATKTLVNQDKAVEAIKEFNSVEHRLELVKQIDGVKWYNDSVSSSPTRTIAGLNSYDEPIVLIAGGYDKNLDYTPIAKPIIQKVKCLILLGQTSGKIFDAVKEELENQGKELPIYMCTTLKQTIDVAKKEAKSGDVVLFSPASASFDLFKNFADRGNQFKKLVNEL